MDPLSVNTALIWFSAGVFFLVLEALTPGLFLLFFGLGAWAAAGADLAGLGLTGQFLVFMAVSLAGLAVFRKKIKTLLAARPGRAGEIDDPLIAAQYLGREVTVVSATAPGRPGLVEFNGTNWQARSESASFQPGDRARVTRREGLTLVVEKIAAA